MLAWQWGTVYCVSAHLNLLAVFNCLGCHVIGQLEKVQNYKVSNCCWTDFVQQINTSELWYGQGVQMCPMYVCKCSEWKPSCNIEPVILQNMPFLTILQVLVTVCRELGSLTEVQAVWVFFLVYMGKATKRSSGLHQILPSPSSTVCN